MIDIVIWGIVTIALWLAGAPLFLIVPALIFLALSLGNLIVSTAYGVKMPSITVQVIGLASAVVVFWLLVVYIYPYIK